MKNENIFILQKNVMAEALAPAIDTFIVVGKHDPDACISLWYQFLPYKYDIIRDECVSAISLSKHLQLFPNRKFFDDTGAAGIIRQVNGKWMLFSITPLIATLLKHHITIIDIADNYDRLTTHHDMNDGIKDVNDVASINTLIIDKLLLGKKAGNLFHSCTMDSSLFEKDINWHRNMFDDMYLVVYIDTRVSDIRDIETMLYSSQVPHESILVNDNALMHISVHDITLEFSLIENEGKELVL